MEKNEKKNSFVCLHKKVCQKMAQGVLFYMIIS